MIDHGSYCGVPQISDDTAIVNTGYPHDGRDDNADIGMAVVQIMPLIRIMLNVLVSLS